MSYEKTVDYLFQKRQGKSKLNLNNITQLCSYLKKPQNKLKKIIHVSGTNGKGSTCSLIASILQESGAKVGLYTSPHILDFRERIKINGVSISKEKVSYYISKLHNISERTNASFFDITTALAIKYFSDEKVDFAVFETGLGGRLDSTNILKSKIAAVTKIAMDHEHILGDSLESICTEKCGIIKNRSLVFTSTQHIEALEVIVKVAKRTKSNIFYSSLLANERNISIIPGFISFDITTPKNEYINLGCPLWGYYQIENIKLAMIIAENLECSPFSIRRGIKNVIKNTGIRGRLEIINKNPLTILDISHNPEGIHKTILSLDAVKQNFEKKIVLFNCLNRKDVDSMVEKLSLFASEIWSAPLSIKGETSSNVIGDLSSKKDVRFKYFEKVTKAIDFAKSNLSEKDILLIIGSFHLVSKSLQNLEKVESVHENETSNMIEKSEIV